MPTARILVGQSRLFQIYRQQCPAKTPKRVKNPAFFMLSVRINVLCPAEFVCDQPNLKLCPAILLTEVNMYTYVFSIVFSKSLEKLPVLLILYL